MPFQTQQSQARKAMFHSPTSTSRCGIPYCYVSYPEPEFETHKAQCPFKDDMDSDGVVTAEWQRSGSRRHRDSADSEGDSADSSDDGLSKLRIKDLKDIICREGRSSSEGGSTSTAPRGLKKAEYVKLAREARKQELERQMRERAEKRRRAARLKKQEEERVRHTRTRTTTAKLGQRELDRQIMRQTEERRKAERKPRRAPVSNRRNRARTMPHIRAPNVRQPLNVRRSAVGKGEVPAATERMRRGAVMYSDNLDLEARASSSSSNAQVGVSRRISIDQDTVLRFAEMQAKIEALEAGREATSRVDVGDLVGYAPACGGPWAGTVRECVAGRLRVDWRNGITLWHPQAEVVTVNLPPESIGVPRKDTYIEQIKTDIYEKTDTDDVDVLHQLMELRSLMFASMGENTVGSLVRDNSLRDLFDHDMGGAPSTPLPALPELSTVASDYDESISDSNEEPAEEVAGTPILPRTPGVGETHATTIADAVGEADLSRPPDSAPERPPVGSSDSEWRTSSYALSPDDPRESSARGQTNESRTSCTNSVGARQEPDRRNQAMYGLGTLPEVNESRTACTDSLGSRQIQNPSQEDVEPLSERIDGIETWPEANASQASCINSLGSRQVPNTSQDAERRNEAADRFDTLLDFSNSSETHATSDEVISREDVAVVPMEIDGLEAGLRGDEGLRGQSVIVRDTVVIRAGLNDIDALETGFRDDGQSMMISNTIRRVDTVVDENTASERRGGDEVLRCPSGLSDEAPDPEVPERTPSVEQDGEAGPRADSGGLLRFQSRPNFPAATVRRINTLMSEGEESSIGFEQIDYFGNEIEVGNLADIPEIGAEELTHPPPARSTTLPAPAGSLRHSPATVIQGRERAWTLPASFSRASLHSSGLATPVSRASQDSVATSFRRATRATLERAVSAELPATPFHHAQAPSMVPRAGTFEDGVGGIGQESTLVDRPVLSAAQLADDAEATNVRSDEEASDEGSDEHRMEPQLSVPVLLRAALEGTSVSDAFSHHSETPRTPVENRIPATPRHSDPHIDLVGGDAELERLLESMSSLEALLRSRRLSTASFMQRFPHWHDGVQEFKHTRHTQSLCSSQAATRPPDNPNTHLHNHVHHHIHFGAQIPPSFTPPGSQSRIEMAGKGHDIVMGFSGHNVHSAADGAFPKIPTQNQQASTDEWFSLHPTPDPLGKSDSETHHGVGV